MKGVLINDHDNRTFLTVDLIDILRALSSEALACEWKGAAADQLEELSVAQAIVPGQLLLELASNIDQTIEGYFEAYKLSTKAFWLTIRAVDSSFFHVWSEDENVLTLMRRQFNDVTDYFFDD